MWDYSADFIGETGRQDAIRYTARSEEMLIC